MIRDAEVGDGAAIAEIYNHYIQNTIVTFEEDSVEKEEMQKRLMYVSKKLPWLVFEQDKQILGYAYASEWKSRCAYRHSLETTVYLKDGMSGKGIGSKLYAELIRRLKHKDYHTLIGGISLPNEGSVALHQKFGFEKIAQFKEVGFKFGKWIDVGYWQLILE
ncbi:arsinothricin resistance N-acetyltransferase ArsN1 family B [Labilibacter marinus]|uniref:arsinothricin resistance N-acetyltransferase ArsN1 family B n=1 Tax=Labilibacter marinus TaxID=1477105 RepID=UPI00094FAEF3|nr:arsinothricin resistance N-acetyltransferase ArsN1 family B [Labilibacter marinus]